MHCVLLSPPPLILNNEYGSFHFSQILITRNFRVGLAPNTKDTPHHYTSVGHLTWQRCNSHCALRRSDIDLPPFLPPSEVELPWLRGIRIFYVYTWCFKTVLPHFTLNRICTRLIFTISLRFFMVKSVTPNALLEHD